MEGLWKVLIGVLVDETFPEGKPDDLKVEPERPLLNIFQIVFDPLLERGITTPAIDLG